MSRFLGILSVFAIVGLAFATTALPTLATLLTPAIVVDDPLEHADFIYVLNGKISVRAEHTAALYRAGIAPRIVIARSVEEAYRFGSTVSEVPASAVLFNRIYHRGVPESAVHIIQVPGGVASTRDEARALRSYLMEHPARKVVVVTTDYHTARARRTLMQEVEGLGVDLRMSAAPDDTGVGAENWWRSVGGIRTYGEELIKHAGTVMRLDR
jgi:uncharacterized SAM-binding protein YcdF (DUF218 family)